ncbi:hypothetical protein V1264_010257 [Littorina saxatilis]|uniref:Protein kinase domain-containing protein n=1 Tax=Littorina saxatilis TaxID=31220 RepID=A0AAN9AP77_9CAEN
MFTRRSSILLLLLPAIGYTCVMYTLIGRTCSVDSYVDVDYVDLGEPRRRRVLVKQPSPPSDGSQEIFVPVHSEKVMHFRGDKAHGGTLSSDLTDLTKRKPSYLFNCTNISVMKLKKKIGHGVSKQTFLGEFQGRNMAVKMVTRHIHDVKTCLENVRGDDATAAAARSKCYTYSTLKLMKEVLLAEQLNHPNIAQLMGYCVRSEESDSTDIAEHGVVSVFELGSRFVLDSLQILPWPVRLRYALEMADLLDYLQNSPLGSLVIPDFKEGHFVIVNSSLKLIDLDDINNVEPACAASSFQGDRDFFECEYSVKCQRALCVGFNAKENLKNMNRLIFKRLLFPLTFPEVVVKEVGQLNARLDLLSLTAAELKAQLLGIQSRAHSGKR